MSFSIEKPKLLSRNSTNTSNHYVVSVTSCFCIPVSTHAPCTCCFTCMTASTPTWSQLLPLNFPPKLKDMRLKWDCSENFKQLEAMNYNRNMSYLMLNSWYSVFKNLLIVYLAQWISLNFLILPIPNPFSLGMSMDRILSSVFSPPTSPSQSNSLLPQSFSRRFLKNDIFCS